MTITLTHCKPLTPRTRNITSHSCTARRKVLVTRVLLALGTVGNSSLKKKSSLPCSKNDDTRSGKCGARSASLSRRAQVAQSKDGNRCIVTTACWPTAQSPV